ncbi:MAG TPA: hydroxyisourate hydrolase [Kiritimatiellia bacterium]|nr:hydroxyisourate hydrolase [Kiritimatiellia bacterium]HMO98447.1 hydroxyisourate hydrolase [Kiritimatiellia bacterium]HMP95865.1 hydroxyisourate hydrolase [Kiritimatiellia bacterium]
MTKRSPITTHVLDTALGQPAAGVPVRLFVEASSGEWTQLSAGTTNADGRVADLLPSDHDLQPGRYRMHFNTEAYFSAVKIAGFYPYADIVFEIRDTSAHYHIPLLLSPYGYSTYRGS